VLIYVDLVKIFIRKIFIAIFVLAAIKRFVVLQSLRFVNNLIASKNFPRNLTFCIRSGSP